MREFIKWYIAFCLLVSIGAIIFGVYTIYKIQEAKASVPPVNTELEEHDEVAVLHSGVLSSHCVGGMIVVTWDNSIIQLLNEHGKPMTCPVED